MRLCCLGFRDEGFGFRVYGLGFRALGLAKTDPRQPSTD